MNTPNCKSCEILARHGQTMLVHTCRINPYALSHTAPSVSASTTVPEREGVEPTQIHEPYCKKLHVGECDCISNPPSEKQEAEGLKNFCIHTLRCDVFNKSGMQVCSDNCREKLEDFIRQTRKEVALKTVEEAYKFPKWFTEDTKREFFDMWACFSRVPADYFSNSSTQMNHQKCSGKELIGKRLVVGEYFHKSANIGWIFDGKEIRHIYNASLSTLKKSLNER